MVLLVVQQLLQIIFISININNVCGQVQCTRHSQYLPVALDSSMLGYSNASQAAYLIGGKDSTGAFRNDVYKWDVQSSSNSFTSIAAPAPTVMMSGGRQIVATINNVIYIVSPRMLDDRPYTTGSAIYRFDTTTDQWLSPISFITPSGNMLHAPCVSHNESHIILVDGYDWNRQSGPIYILFYAVLTNEWTTHTLAAPFTATGKIAAWYAKYCSYAQENLYIFGGTYYPTWTTNNIYLDGIYKYDIASSAFSVIGRLPTPQAYGIAVYDGSRYIYLVGGKVSDSGSYLDAIRIFDVGTEQLLDETLTAVVPFRDSTSMILDEQLWIFGGWNGYNALAIVQACDISSFTTTSTTTTPTDATAESPDDDANRAESNVNSFPWLLAATIAAFIVGVCLCFAAFVMLKRSPREKRNPDKVVEHQLEINKRHAQLQMVPNAPYPNAVNQRGGSGVATAERAEGLRVPDATRHVSSGGLAADEFEVVDDQTSNAHTRPVPYGLQDDEFVVVDDNESAMNSTRRQ